MRETRLEQAYFTGRTAAGKLAGLAVMAAAVFPFCEDSQAVKVPTKTAAVVEEGISLAAAPMSDILFVVDNSGSMAEEQEQLAVNFQKFIDVVDEAANWYQIGIVTTDMNTGVGLAGCTCPKAQDEDCTPGYELRFGGKLQSAPGVPKVLKPPKNRPRKEGDPMPDADAPPDSATLRDWFAQSVHLGIDGCGFEKGLEASRAAICQSGSAPQELCTGYAAVADNAGFFRPDAVLIVIWVTDEEDCSHSPEAFKEKYGDECVRFSNLLTKTSEYIDFFRNVKGDPRKVALASICGAVITQFDEDGNPTEIYAGDCKQDESGNPVPVAGNCDPTQQGACAGRRYIEVVNSLSGMVDSICRGDFSSTMIRLGNFVKEVNSYSLSRTPDCDDPNCEGEIMVKVSMCETADDPVTCAAGQGYPQCASGNITQTDCYECGKAPDGKMKCWRRLPQCTAQVADNCWEYQPPTGGGKPIIAFRGNALPRLGQEVKILFLVDPESGGGGREPPPPPPADGGQ